MIEDIATTIGYIVMACLIIVSFVEMIGIVVGLKELHDCCGKF